MGGLGAKTGRTMHVVYNGLMFLRVLVVSNK